MEGVSQILLQLEPAVTFNAAEVWKNEISGESKKAAPSTATSKADLYKEKNFQEQQTKKFVTEVTKIRNSKGNLLGILKDVKIADARVILYVQILKNAFDDFNKTRNNIKAKKLLYEIVWALNEMGLPSLNAPKPADNKLLNTRDPSLVYDNYKDAEALLKAGNKLMAEEEDLIKLQLVEMSDSLPPLSKFSSGFKLDNWQKRVLTWIDAGKSVVICAPTSSGKTVLSSYVAIIFKSHIFKDEAGKDEKQSKTSGKKGNRIQDNTEAGEDVLDEEDEVLFDDEEQMDKLKAAQSQSRRSAEELQASEEEDFTLRLVAEDSEKRASFLRLKRELQLKELKSKSGSSQRVLFVVPTEPLVWQVAAYFTKLMKEEGDRQTRVALVTDQFTFRPKQKLDVVPQIVVGTPLALESALTKPFGLTGREETKGIPAGNILPGGFDHFDWVIYDEVHALDGPEGAALQRLIRAMSCPFLALSATIGNADHLRSWLESVKGEQLRNVEALTVSPSFASPTSLQAREEDVQLNIVGRFDTSSTRVGILKAVSSNIIIFDDTKKSELVHHIRDIWHDIATDATVLGEPSSFKLNDLVAKEDNYSVKQAGLLDSSSTSRNVVLEAVSGVGNEGTTVVGFGKLSQSTVRVQAKVVFQLPVISVPEDRKAQDIQKLLQDLFPWLLQEANERRSESKFLVKNSEVKDVTATVESCFTSSKQSSQEKLLETSLTLNSFNSNEISRIIDDFNQANSAGGDSVKVFPVKLHVQLSFDPLEIYYLETTVISELKAHVHQLWDRRFSQTSNAVETLTSLSTSTQVSFRATRMQDNYTLAKYGLFHPSVSHEQRVVTGNIQIASSESHQIRPTVVGKAQQAVHVVSVKKYLSSHPLEVLLTDDVTIRELKSHVRSVWSLDSPSLADVSSFYFVGEPTLEDSEVLIAHPSLVSSELEIKNSTEGEVQKQLQDGLNLSRLSVIGKGSQRPYRLTLIRTAGTLEEEVGGAQSHVVVFEDTTVSDIKKQVCTIWKDLNADPSIQAPHVKHPVQLLYNSIDLLNEDSTLASYGLLDERVDDNERIVVVRSLVHLLIHQGRFINLQRYIWNQADSRSKLSQISPLAAVSSVAQLQEGILLQSNLSFTSKDCYRTYEELKKIFPKEIAEECSPYKFFKKRERITLQRSKDYEDFLKSQITKLARQFPEKTGQLLNSFQIQDVPRVFNLCDLVQELKQSDMLPCLPFHLNSFEAIRLFQQLLSDLEYRQKAAHPTYYLDLQADVDRRRKENDRERDAQGKNEKNIEEVEKTLEIVSDVDIYAPHPAFTACKGAPLSQQELDQLVADMERYDGFEKRDANAMRENKGQNQTILRHALIRGLRRGIGLFIDEVSFPSYRRAIQKLASNGKLGVVISDGSLAFGVNMPFRTCIFCGEMRGTLDELMAQQMSGRAGRRGLDEQGNVIYAGIRVPMIRKIMIGKISNITGRKYPTKYDTMFLQAVLSPRHTGYYRAELLGGRTLSEFIDGVESDPRFSMTVSKKTMIDLGFIAPTRNKDYQPNFRAHSTYGLLTAVWEMRNCIYESITIGMLLNDIIEEFVPIIAPLSLNEKKRNTEIMEPYIHSFFSILIQLIGRTPVKRHGVKVTDLAYFHHQNHRELYDRWASKFAEHQSVLDAKGYSHLKNPVPPGTELDGTFLSCAIDRHFIHTLDEASKQDMKQMIWHVGSVLLILNKVAHVEPEYNRVGHFLFRNAFEKLRYLNSELIASVIDFDNIAAAEAERRIDAKSAIIKPQQAQDWTDLSRISWSEAIGKFYGYFDFVILILL